MHQRAPGVALIALRRHHAATVFDHRKSAVAPGHVRPKRLVKVLATPAAASLQ
jgi:hypothetical protein